MSTAPQQTALPEPAAPTWSCLNCKQSFAAGEWQCSSTPGFSHVVAEKTYLLADAPQQSGLTSGRLPLALHGRTIIVLSVDIGEVPPGSYLTSLNAKELGAECVFVDGRYGTDDPQTQYELNQRSGWATEEQWLEAWRPGELREQRRDELERNLAKGEERLQQMERELVQLRDIRAGVSF